MPLPKLQSDLLGRPARRRRRRRRLIGLAVIVLLFIAWRWGLHRKSIELATVSTSTETLLPIEPPRIVIPPGLDEYLSPTDDKENKGRKANVVPSQVNGQVAAGESLFDALRQKGVPAHSIQPVVNSVGALFDFRRSRVGDTFDVELDPEGTILRFRYQSVPEVYYEARLIGPGEYEAVRAEVPLDIETFTMAATIEGSLYATVKNQGESESLARRITQVFQWDIDFSRDVRPGDAFRMIYERVNLNGNFLRYGRLLAVEYRGSRVSERAYWFEAEETSGFFTSEGQPLERMFLRAPCQYRRISSGFSLARMHPVLGRIRPHLGVDYAADTGTPVIAVADGVVDFVGAKGAAGNMVSLVHEHQYRSAYAHLHGFARGLKRGDRVRQGQVIGYVGNTGRSTGAHLHFAMKHKGQFIDPLKRSDQRMPGLKGRELQEFFRVRDRLQLELEEHPLPEVMLDTQALDDDIPLPTDAGGEDDEAYEF